MGTEKGAIWYDDVYRKSPSYRASPEDANWAPLWAEAAEWVESIGVPRVVDLGCGPGHLPRILAGRSALSAVEYDGYDFSSEAVRRAEDLRLGPRFRFHVRDLITNGIPQAPDAAYVLCEFLEHIEADLDVLSGIPDGTPVFFTVPKFDTESHVRHFIRPKEVADRYGSLFADIEVRPVGAHWYAGSGVKRCGMACPAGSEGIAGPPGPRTASVSLCMIVRDEEATLARVLDSVRDLVDEINIVDTGSKDGTKDVARRYTDRVFDFPWTGKFSDARNESFRHATKEYTFFLDADDILLGKDREKLRSLKDSLDRSVDSVSMWYVAGEDEYGNPTLKYRRNRLVRTSRGFQWTGDCHNLLEVRGKILDSDIEIRHRKVRHATGRALSIYRAKMERGEAFGPRDWFYYGNELREAGDHAEAVGAYDRNLSARDGWVEDKIWSCIYRADCLRSLGDAEAELRSLFESFRFAAPRAEACCRIGDNFKARGEHLRAVFWYELAIRQIPEEGRWSFTYPAFHTWYPHLQLCVCYHKLGDTETSRWHNEQAAIYRPEDSSVKANRKFFEGLVK